MQIALKTRRSPLNDLGWYIYITFTSSFKVTIKTKEEKTMRGYFTAGGYFGMVNGSYVLFSDESEYYEYVEEED